MTAVRAYLAVPFIRRLILLLVLFAALLVLVETGWRRPLLVEHRAAATEFTDLRDEVAELRSRIDSIETYARIESQLSQLSERFEAPVDRSGVVETLSALSTASGTRIIHGANSFGRPRGDVTPVEQDLTIEGSYGAVGRFLNDLQGLETLTLLRSAEFSANPDGTLVRAKIKLLTLSAEAGG